MQIWKDIEGYKGHYQISNYGNVRSLKKDAFLMKGGYLKGYKIINLWKNGTGKMFRVHRLVAAAFIPNPEKKALNMAAGWSDNKKLYLLDGVKFK